MQDASEERNHHTGRRYQLRRAAGLYWLIDMEQSGVPYISPVPLNEGGAKIWELIESGASVADISGRLSDMYGIAPAQARRDVTDFIEQLRSKRIDLEELE